MQATKPTFDKRQEVIKLKEHYELVVKEQHLAELLKDEERNRLLTFELGDDMIVDFTHTKIDRRGIELLVDVAKQADLESKIERMFSGEIINNTENRPAWHVLLRRPVEDENSKPVFVVKNQIKAFADEIRSGSATGFTGQKINTVVSIGIGGSYLGPEFVYEALRTSKAGIVAAGDMKLKFLANVDPIDFSRALEGVDVETTLFIIVSKTFTTAETMLNARQARTYIQ